MSNVSITKIETVNGNTITTLFHPFDDTITLRLVIGLSPNLTVMKNLTAKITYQIIELLTNEVVYSDTQQSNFNTDSVVWIHAGTADGLGLKWNGSDLFGFRGAVEFFTDTGGGGLQAVDNAFVVSGIHWFRLMDIFGL